MSACAVVVYGNNRVGIHFGNATDGVIDALLHFGVGTLHGVELDVVFVLTCGNATYCAAAHADSVIVAAEHHDRQVGGRSAFDAILTTRITNAARLHYHLVKTIHPAVFLVLECEQRTINQRLSKLVAEVARAVGRLDENLHRGLIEPIALLYLAFPTAAVVLKTRVRCHINCRTSNRETALAARHTVANFAARTCCSTIERLHGGREIVGFCLHRKHRLHVLDFKFGGLVGLFGRKLLRNVSVKKRHIVFVSGYDTAWIGFGSVFYELEKRFGLFFAVNYKSAAENLVSAVFGVNLRKTKHFGVCKRSAELFGESFEVLDFGFAESETFLLVVGTHIFDMHNWVGLFVDGEDIFVNVLIHTL